MPLPSPTRNPSASIRSDESTARDCMSMVAVVEEAAPPTVPPREDD